MQPSQSKSPSRKANEIGVFPQQSAYLSNLPAPQNVRGSKSPFRDYFAAKPRAPLRTPPLYTRQPAKVKASQNYVNNQYLLIQYTGALKTSNQLGGSVGGAAEDEGRAFAPTGTDYQALGTHQRSTYLYSEILHYMADPQIYINFVTSAGELPRSIALERKRREIASVDFVYHIDFEITQELAVFDDDEFGTKSFEQWQKSARDVEIYDANQGKNRTVKGLYGQCWINGKWEKCVIIGQREGKLLVYLREKNSAIKYFIPRLFCFIWGDNPLIYCRRLSNALFMKQLTESILRYNSCVENMPTNGLVPFSSELSARIAKLVEISYMRRTVLTFKADSPEFNAIREKVYAMMPELMKEVQFMYAISQNKILFEISLQKQPSLIIELNLEKAVEFCEKYKQSAYCNFYKTVFPYTYMIGISSYHFGDTCDEIAYNVKQFLTEKHREIKNKISFESFLTHNEAIKALQIAQFETARLLAHRINQAEIGKRSLADEYFDVSALSIDYLQYDYSLYQVFIKAEQPVIPLLQKTYSCEEFKSVYAYHQKAPKSFLEDQWIIGIKNYLIECLKHSGKGHFNIYVKSKQVYLQSKLRKLVLRIIYQLNDTIRFLVENSVRQLVEMFRINTNWVVRTVDSQKVLSRHRDNDYNAEDPDTALTCYRNPIFNITITVSDKQPGVEEKSILERLESTYIYGISPLKEDNDRIDESSEEEQQQEEQPQADEYEEIIKPDSSFAYQPTAEKAQEKNDRAQRRKKEEYKDAKPVETKIKALTFSHTFEDFKDAVETVFDGGIKAVSSIPDIEPMLLLSIVQSEQTFVCPPEITEEQFKEAKSKIFGYIEQAFRYLPDYLKSFGKYRELLYLDDQKWIATIKYRAELYLQQQKDAENQAPKDTDGAEELPDVPPIMLEAISQATPLDPAALRDLVYERLNQAKTLLVEIPEAVHIGVFLVKNAYLRYYLCNKCYEMAEAVYQVIIEIASQKAVMISQAYVALSRRLTHKSKSIEEVCKLEDYLKTRIAGNIKAMQANISTMNQYFSILDELLLQQPPAVVNYRWKTAAYPRELDTLWKQTVQIIEADKLKFKDQQLQEYNTLAKEIDTATRQIQNFPHKYTKIEEYATAYEDAERLLRQSQRNIEKCKLINRREQLMGLPVTDYSSFDAIARDFAPITAIWQSMADYKKLQNAILNDDFKFVNAERTESTIDTAYRAVAKAQRNINDNQEEIRLIAEQIKQEIGDFKKFLPLLTALRNPGLRRRHWLKISKQTNCDLRNLRYINGVELKQFGRQNDDDEKSDNDYTEMTAEYIDDLNKMPVNFTFKQALEQYELNNPAKMAVVVQISDIAAKEYGIEYVLLQLESAWGDIKFKLGQYQNSDCYILKALDDIIYHLDDDITMIQAMSFSPFKKYFEEAISGWEYKLSLTSEIIDVWVQVQQSWLYLEPIFSSGDIVKQLPNESKIFKTVDSFWRKFMSNVQKILNVVKVCTETEKLLPKLRENHKSLELVQKGLSDYLETKRIAFPRFFFLSDEELLSILSNTKNPTSVQPFLRSLFENISRIKFVEENGYEMVSMTSHEGEIVQFTDGLMPAGNVEVWMGQLERLIIRTTKIRCLETLKLYLNMVSKGGVQGRASWVKSGFAQGVNLVNQLAFTNDTNWAIANNYLGKYNDYLNKQLDMMTELVRNGMSKLESKCFSALLTYDVFYRDAVYALIDNNTVSVGDFNWSKHPKHVCNVNTLYLQPVHGIADNYYGGKYSEAEYERRIQAVVAECDKIYGDFMVSFNQVLSTLPYAFEYLGNTQRLVITPLTLKIYSTVSQSQSMFKFTAASGPAGSGKTETSKQVTNKEFGLVCVVFNCSEGLDLIGIKRMLSGVISTGGCLVMDEINRLSLDVLSVFAQMVLGVQRGLYMCGGSIVKPAADSYGKSMAHIQTTKIAFEGTELNLSSTAVVIITQNPNYSGRQKLPANLVALFRAVSVMVPNYMKICQIRLYSFGFKKATSLAQKAVSVFKLCSEQLSLQSWYDYGMRAINSTIQAAGNIRQELGQLCCQDSKQIPLIDCNGTQVPDPHWYTEDQIVLRAITEVNLPKFLANDAFLFSNILKDLFPGVYQPFIDYNKLMNELRVVLRSNQLSYLYPTDAYIGKIVDLYMTINLRHGLMTLGPACSGKTESIYALTAAMNRLNKREFDERLARFNKLMKQQPDLPVEQIQQYIPEDYAFMRYNVSRINPKSITMDQLFGYFDAVSKEWYDGVLSTQIRNAVGDYNKHLAWVDSNLYNDGFVPGSAATIYDVNPQCYLQKANYTRQLCLSCGYIDSLWIESLNTVLDDSKRLCLTSGEIIALSPVMNLIFNMDSVAEASPATISRCGMLYYGALNITSVGTTKADVGQLVITGPIPVAAYIYTWVDRLPDQLRLANPDVYKIYELRKGFETKHGSTEEYSALVVQFKQLFELYLPQSIAYVRANCTMLQEVMDTNLIQSTLRIVDTFVRELKTNDFGLLEYYYIAIFMRYLKPIFVFSLVWGIGGVIGDEQSRLLFSNWLKKELRANSTLAECQLPDEETVFDYEFRYKPYEQYKEAVNQELQDGRALSDIINAHIEYRWQLWGKDQLGNVDMEQLMVNGNKQLSALQSINLAEVIIPTTSNIAQSYILQRLLSNGFHTMVVGQTGSGKTSVIKNYLFKHEDAKVQIPINVTFSANTYAGDLMTYIDGKLEKRRRGVYGPMTGKKFMVYIDDLNMPAKERYGCINSHEIIRQLIHHGGWFDLKEIQFKQIVDTYVVTSMVQAGGARSAVTYRLVRHFNVLNFLELSDQVLSHIFSNIVNYWSERVFDAQILGDELHDYVLECMGRFVTYSINVYNNTRNGLLPTPSKMHYTFNLRDLSKVFQGILMVDPQSIYLNIEQTQKAGDLVFNSVGTIKENINRLFVHESLRVYSDRLVDKADEDWFQCMLDKEFQTVFTSSLSASLNGAVCSDLVYGDFLQTGTIKGYRQIKDFGLLDTKLSAALQEYGEISGYQMNLVLFKVAVQHLARIVRVLRQPNSNMLLIGVGGTGRQSLTKLASSLLKYDISSIELKKGYSLNDWKEDVKQILLQAGLYYKQVVFLLSDQYFFADKQLEDISIMLNTCDLQHVYEQADIEEINSKMKPICMERGLQPTKINLYDCFVSIVKKNIHVVLCFSPSGSSLRTRLRKFPALVNCCSIDYIFNWPQDALYDVGKQTLGFVNKAEGSMIDPTQIEFLNMFLEEQAKLQNKPIGNIRTSVIEYCVAAHRIVEQFSILYKNELQRFNHVTPTLYLNLLSFLIVVIQDKYKAINTYKMQLSSGLEKLTSTQEKVAFMQQELRDLQPQLVESSKKVEEMMGQITADTAVANEAKAQADVEKQSAAAKLAECQAIEADAQRDLAYAQPLLDAAMTVLNALSKADFNEMGSYANPALAIRQCMEAVCILLQIKPKRIADSSKPGSYIEDYWDESKKVLSNSAYLMTNLKTYDKEHIPEQVIKKLEYYIKLEDFTPQVMKTKSQAASGLCAFAIAMYKFYFINLEVIPKRQALAKAQAELAVVEDNLAKTNAKIDEIYARLTYLTQQYQNAIDEKNEIDRKVSDTAKRLDRAQTLIVSLSGEYSRWEQQLKALDVDMKNLLGDALYAVSVVIYQGAFTSDFRARITAKFVQKLAELSIPCSVKNNELRLTDILSDQVTLMGYCNQFKLPSDMQSMENSVILFKSQKFSLCIDPEGYAQNFLRNYYKEQPHEIVKANDKDLLRTLENCIRFGKILLITNVTDDIDPALNTVLDRVLVKDGNQTCMKLGDALIPYNPQFQLYLCTHLNNPNYAPEQFVKLCVINFAITPIGLQDQLLGVLVTQERPDQEALKNSLVISNSKNKQELKELEQQVLRLLSTSEGDILQNEYLIDTLAKSYKTSKEIADKVKEAEATEAEIDLTRKQYIPMAERASIIYFCIYDLVQIEFMYQYSLTWYVQMYNQAILDTEPADDLSQRLGNLISHFTLFAYQCVCRSLFEAHKMLFAFLIACRIQLNAKEINLSELRYLLVGSMETAKSSPPADFISDKAWAQVCGLEKIGAVFANISHSFRNGKDLQTWRTLFESMAPEQQSFPAPYETELTAFQRFLPIAALRPDRIVAYMRKFVTSALGSEFAEPQIMNLEKSFKDSANVKPLLFLLNDMADPISDLMAFADTMRMSRKIQVISLGRGVEKSALALIQEFAERGNWAVLQNCHLCAGFLVSLQAYIDYLQADPQAVHRDFRLWLTSQPTEQFPVGILQNAVKISVENPNNLKSNLMRVWSNQITEKMLNEACTEVEQYKMLTYSLSVFYSVLLQRKKYGAIGFNTPYAWSTSDVAVCFMQLPTFLEQYRDDYPYEALMYLFSQINIGGCVTDSTDQRTVDALATDYLVKNAMMPKWCWQRGEVAGAETPEYMLRQPSRTMSYREYLDQIQQTVPIECHPENLGLNANSNITADQNESASFLADMLRLQTGKLNEQKYTNSPEQEKQESATDASNDNSGDISMIYRILGEIPQQFNIAEITLKYPTKYEESLNSLLVQECGRYNTLLEVMQSSLQELIRALRGLTILSPELEEVLYAMQRNRIPALFDRYSFPSLKPMSSYMRDLNQRVMFFNNWIIHGKPRVFCISSFFFAQGFLTSLMQNYARRYSIAIDTVQFSFALTDQVINDDEMIRNANKVDFHAAETADGTFISGLFMEAARYSTSSQQIEEAAPRELYAKMPVFVFTPTNQVESNADTKYSCPCYRTLARFGLLSTTGHSTNFLLFIDVPCAQGTARHWIKRSVALFANLSD